MKLKSIIPFLSTIFLLSFLIIVGADTCQSENRIIKGTLANDPESEIIINLKRLGGEPFRINSLEFKDVSFRCFSGEVRSGKISGVVGKMKIRRQTNPFTQKGRAFVFSSKSDQLTTDKQIAVFILGVVNKKGTAASGNFGISFGDGCSEGGSSGFKKFQ